MPRLSIVIPCVHDASDFEDTLASVLQNRPKRCEILVVQPRPYHDPYALSSEVRFLETSPDRSMIELINIGVQQAKSEIIHLLGCRERVTDCWTDPVLPHFADSTVGSVTPRLVRSDHPDQVVAVGVGYDAGGRRNQISGPSIASQPGKTQIVGPLLTAGFYRRQAILDVGGFCADVGEPRADVDLAINLQAFGYQTVHEAGCTIATWDAAAKESFSFRDGLESERLFWRNAAVAGWRRALVRHGWVIASQLLMNAYRPSIMGHTWGRLLASSETATYQLRRRKLETAKHRQTTTHPEHPEAVSFRNREPQSGDDQSEVSDDVRRWRSAA